MYPYMKMTETSGKNTNDNTQIKTKKAYKVIFDFNEPNGYAKEDDMNNAYWGIEDNLSDWVNPDRGVNISDQTDASLSYNNDIPDAIQGDKINNNDNFFQYFVQAMNKRKGKSTLSKTSYYLENHTIEFFKEYASLHKMSYSETMRLIAESVEEAITTSKIDPFSDYNKM